MVMKVRHYADGGKVEIPGPETRKIKPAPMPPPKKGMKPKKLADGGKVTSGKTPKKPPPPQPAPPRDTVQRDPKGSTTDTLRNQRARQMRDLGLKDGGKVKRRKRY